MKNIEIEVLDEESLELVASLRALGMTRNEAPLIVFLSGVEVATSKGIEARTGLRQPEVSIGMRMLRSRDWIREEGPAHEGLCAQGHLKRDRKAPGRRNDQ